MYIMICDDDAAQVEQIKRFLASRPGYRIAAYCSGADLLANLPEKCDIAILDIKLQDMLGTKIAQKLKAIYPMIDIILISSYPKYVTSAFHIKASQFIIKPIRDRSFLREFDRILSERASRHFRWIITSKGTILSFFPAEIIYIEAYHRHLFIHTEKQTFEICKQLKEARQTLEGYGFILCHQGFLVNAHHIRRINTDSILCSNGDSIPISVRRKKSVLQQYVQFIEI